MIKNLLTLLTFLPLFLSAQSSWVAFRLETDTHPEEFSWYVENVATGDTVDQGGPYGGGSYGPGGQRTEIAEYIPLSTPGDYILWLVDSAGNGFDSIPDAEVEFFLGNWCGEVNTSEIPSYTNWQEWGYPFTVNYCILPILGCDDPNSSNYDSTATWDRFGFECEYIWDVTFQLDISNAPPMDTPEVNGIFNAWCGDCNQMTDMGNGIWETTISIPGGIYPYKFSADDFTIQEQPFIGANNSCFQEDFGFVNRILDVDRDTVLPLVCWESCLPCGAVPGCTDPTSPNWNPWANYDDGTCLITCPPNSEILQIELTTDQYPDETEWEVRDENDSLIGRGGPFTQGNTTYVDRLCIPNNTQYQFFVFDEYGDGLCGSCFGGIDGEVIVTRGNCDTIYELYQGDADFGFVDSSMLYNMVACNPGGPIFGCTDSNYVEYNPQATINIVPSCQTLKVYGCLDTNSINYDSTANTPDYVRECDYTLVITDGVGDGWFGNWIGIKQGNWASPRYTMGPQDGTSEIFIVPLKANKKVEVFFFVEGGGGFTSEQCGFYLICPEGDTVVQGGTNVWTDPIKEFPFRYKGVPYCGDLCIPKIYGCTDSLAYNFIDSANTNDGSCYYNPACSNPGYLEYYLADSSLVDYWSEEFCSTLAVFGCTDSIALNYDPTANVDNGGCIIPVYGCMDPEAFNYNENANVEDGTCLYDADCIGNPGDPYWLNDQCYAWVISVDDYCCDNIWDETCQEMYDVCDEQQDIVGLPDVKPNQIIVYPNPVESTLNIIADMEVKVEVKDIVGQVIISKMNPVKLDLSNVAAGTYNVVMTFNGRTLIKTIVKE